MLGLWKSQHQSNTEQARDSTIDCAQCPYFGNGTINQSWYLHGDQLLTPNYAIRDEDGGRLFWQYQSLIQLLQGSTEIFESSFGYE